MRDSPVEAPRRGRDEEHIHRPDAPIPVKAWISQRQTGDFEADAEAVAWTRSQVLVTYSDPHGRAGQAWLWATAVSRRQASP